LNIIIEKPNLTSYQKNILYNEARFTITEASTKAGKTFSHLWWIFELAHESHNKDNFNYWWLAPVYSQAKIAFNRLRVKVAQTGLYKINESNLMITTPLGSRIHFKSAENPDNLYGEDVYGIVFDEAPRAKVEAFYALRTTITKTGCKMKMIGNFGGSANWMHQLKEKALTDPEYSYHKITAWDAVREGILTKDEIEQAQKDLPSKVFRQLYLAEEQEDNDQLCSFAAINDLWTNSHVKLTGNKYLTADVAFHGSDKFVMMVWDGLTITDIKVIERCDGKQVELAIKEMAEKYGVRRSNIVYDADGTGMFLRGYLAGASPFNNGAKAVGTVNYKNLKSQCGYKLAEKINKGEIFIKFEPYKSEIIRELECLKSYELDKDGKMQLLPKIKVKELIGNSPDFLDAMIMRMSFEVKRNSFNAPKLILP
jgi:hypothetical protein